MRQDEQINEYIKDNYGKQTNKELADKIKQIYRETISVVALKKRHSRMMKGIDKVMKESNTRITIENDTAEFITPSGTLQKAKQKIERALIEMGYEADDYIIEPIKFSEWEQQSKSGVIDLQSARFKIEKKLKPALDLKLSIEEMKNVIKKEIKPLIIKETPKNKNKNNTTMYAPAIELHLGKLAFAVDVGENYNSQIAEQRFYEIIEEITEEQKIKQCNKLIFPIGNDLFNYDTQEYATTKGTYQHSDLSPRAMFLKANEMYLKAIKTLEPLFNEIEMQLQPGNHEEQTIFHFYLGLANLFSNSKKIKFKDDYKEFQATMIGNTVIFSSHGNEQELRTANTWATEFPMEWARAIYREWHKGHRHHTENKRMKMSDKEENGLNIRTTKSPSGTDPYHYKNRWVGAEAGYQFYIYDNETGIKDVHYINFDKKKVKIKEINKKV